MTDLTPYRTESDLSEKQVPEKHRLLSDDSPVVALLNISILHGGYAGGTQLSILSRLPLHGLHFMEKEKGLE